MGKKKTDGRKKSNKNFNWATPIFYVIAGYMVFTILGQRQSLNDLNAQKQALTNEKTVVENELVGLQQDLEKINDPEQFLELVERIARDEYRMIRPYETVYIDRNRSQNAINPFSRND